jgi:polyhydroxyalkanoate synthase
MLDFGMPGEIGALITPEMVQQRESSIGNEGVLEGKDLALAFSALRANDLIWPYVVNSYLKGKAPPAFVYASREDHIVPWQTAYASTRLLGGETRFVLGASGHIAGVINPPAKRKRNFWTAGLAPDAPAWLDAAQSVDGSWWPTWTEWLAPHAGALVAAPRAPGSAEHAVSEPAPGRYVKARAE